MSHRPYPTDTPSNGTDPTIASTSEQENSSGVRRSLAQVLGLCKWPGALPDKRFNTGLKGWVVATGIVIAGTVLRLGVLAVLGIANNESMWGLLTKWDGAHYIAIAQSGYFAGTIGDDPAQEIRLAFFPAFPMVMRALHALTGLDYALAGIAFNFVATIFLAAGVMALVSAWGYGLRGQSAGAIITTTAPMSIVFNMPYTEALFGALAVWALVALLDKRWLTAGVIIFALSFVRITSIAVIVVFGLMVLIYARKNLVAWAALIVSPLPLIGFILWASSKLGSVDGYFGTQQKHWNSGFDGGLGTLKWVVKTLVSTETAGYLLTTLVIIGVPCALILAWRRVDIGSWVFSLTLSANVLLSDGVMHSRPRLLLPAALLFIPWALGALRLLPRWTAWLLLACWAIFGAWFSAHMLAVFPWAI